MSAGLSYQGGEQAALGSAVDSPTQTPAETGPGGVKAAREVTVAGLVSMDGDRLWGIDVRLPPSVFVSQPDSSIEPGVNDPRVGRVNRTTEDNNCVW